MSEGEKKSDVRQSVKFLHQRGGYYRAIHADGAWGAVSSASNIHLAFYNERPPIPNAVIQDLGPDGNWIHESLRVDPPQTEPSISRQFEVDVILSLEAAKVVREVLQNFIELAEKMRPKPQ